MKTLPARCHRPIHRRLLHKRRKQGMKRKILHGFNQCAPPCHPLLCYPSRAVRYQRLNGARLADCGPHGAEIGVQARGLASSRNPKKSAARRSCSSDQGLRQPGICNLGGHRCWTLHTTSGRAPNALPARCACEVARHGGQISDVAALAAQRKVGPSSGDHHALFPPYAGCCGGCRRVQRRRPRREHASPGAGRQARTGHLAGEFHHPGTDTGSAPVTDTRGNPCSAARGTTDGHSAALGSGSAPAACCGGSARSEGVTTGPLATTTRPAAADHGASQRDSFPAGDAAQHTQRTRCGHSPQRARSVERSGRGGSAAQTLAPIPMNQRCGRVWQGHRRECLRAAPDLERTTNTAQRFGLDAASQAVRVVRQDAITTPEGFC